jgi:hypothetical protein
MWWATLLAAGCAVCISDLIISIKMMVVLGAQTYTFSLKIHDSRVRRGGIYTYVRPGVII